MAKRKIVELASVATSKPKSKESVFDVLDFVENTVNNMMLDLQNNKVQQVAAQREFRTSSLPFCPILEFLRDPQFEDYKKSHYTSTGTAIHETIQSWLAVSPFSSSMLYGSWECTGCKKVKLNQMKPTKACNCEYTYSTTPYHRRWPKHWTYKEIEYNYNGLTGHIDLVVIPKPGLAFVLDFKTTELEKKKSRISWRADKVSSPNYVAQVRTYATILDLVHNMPIQAWVLVNAERGKPITSIKDFHVQTGLWSRKHSNKWNGLIIDAVDNNKRLLSVETAVKSSEPKQARTALKEVIKHRPCTDQASYDAFMKYKFYQGSCEHCATCFSGSNKAVYDMVVGELSKKD